MKSLIALAIAFISMDSFAASISTVKVFDGRRAYCREKSDMYRNKIGAYQLRGDAARIVDGKLYIDTTIGFIKCVQKENGKYGFVSVPSKETFTYTIIPFNGEKATVTARTEEVVFRLLKMRVTRNGSNLQHKDTPVPGSRSRSSLTVDFDMNSLLSRTEMVALEMGSKIKTSIDAYILKKMSYERSDNGDTWEDTTPFGSFRFHIELERNSNGNIIASLIK